MIYTSGFKTLLGIRTTGKLRVNYMLVRYELYMYAIVRMPNGCGTKNQTFIF